ncbi:MAG: hypothetical protein J0H62_07760 [Rhizobiales bacterium]|nr:hypothetical protein [Hyphomicrobiales bacterium]
MAFPLLALAVATQLVAVSAERVPELNMNPTCRSPMRSELGGTADAQVCLDSENRAREALVKRWSEFTAVSRSECSSLINMGGPPSYIELLTCLEMSTDASRLAKQPKGQGNTGSMVPMLPARPVTNP